VVLGAVCEIFRPLQNLLEVILRIPQDGKLFEYLLFSVDCLN